MTLSTNSPSASRHFSEKKNEGPDIQNIRILYGKHTHAIYDTVHTLSAELQIHVSISISDFVCPS